MNFREKSLDGSTHPKNVPEKKVPKILKNMLNKVSKLIGGKDMTLNFTVLHRYFYVLNNTLVTIFFVQTKKFRQN
jgi:hypothetical protein